VMNNRSTGGLSTVRPVISIDSSASRRETRRSTGAADTLRSLRSQINSMHRQEQRIDLSHAGPLPQIDPLAPSLKVNGKFSWRPPATADTHRADISSLRDRDPAPRRHEAATAPHSLIDSRPRASAAQTWWSADSVAGAESSGPKGGREPIQKLEQSLGFVGGQKPSNRSEAVVLSHSFEELLEQTVTL